MRKPLTLLSTALFAFTACAQLSYARTQTACITGDCIAGVMTQWVACTTYDDATGQVLSRDGTNCLGDHWHDHCRFTSVPSNPGNTSDYVINGSNWWIRYNVDAAGNVTSMWGRHSSGEYWQADNGQAEIL